jgi:Icc-related predicted phosphoesterase
MRGGPKKIERMEVALPFSGTTSVKVVVISDTHNDTNQLRFSIPPGDILIHCGDFTERKDWFGLEPKQIPSSVKNFVEFMASLPHKHKLVIAGNHEIGFNQLSVEEIRELLPGCHYLLDECIEVEGLKIYGTPWTIQAMMGYSAPSETRRQELWNLIPEGLDILVSHSPPRGILDGNAMGKPCGCKLLRERVSQIKPKVHLFGHIHESEGWTVEEGITFVNASFILSKKVFYFDYPLS